ncbi:MAG: NAD(P)-dependent oxidoreductase [Cohaesibacter sp.]|nr:NAD(P)-dependent oxidoreductase [Cohaesibacter sp.]
MKILITGGHGLIGRAIHHEFGKRADLFCFCPTRAEFDLLIEDDRWDKILNQDWNMLVHCAWITAHGDFWNAPDNHLWHEASVRLFERFFEKPDRRLVSLGTCAEYDWEHSDQGPLSECSSCKPATLYGQAKYQTYKALAAYADSMETVDVAKSTKRNSFLWPRLFFTFGEGESRKKLIPAMVEAECQSQPMQCGPEQTERDFCSFSSIGKAIAHLALSSCEGAVNIGTGHGTTLRDIHHMVTRDVGCEDRESSVVFAPASNGAPSCILADVSKACSFGIEINHQETLQEMEDYIASLST